VSKNKKEYNLKERTSLFGEHVIDLCMSMRRNDINTPIIKQLIKSSTSVGANYCEADNAESTKDFKHKIGICCKESDESKYFLRMLANSNPEKIEKCRELWQEANELNLIFNSIIRKLGGRN
jgi:four helix bundle protein